MLEPTGPMAVANHVHSLVTAVDWPMFEKMLAQMKWMFGGLGAIIVALGIYAVRTIKNGFEAGIVKIEERISAQRAEDSKRCLDRRAQHDGNKEEFRFTLFRELDALWERQDECCKKVGLPKVERAARD